MGSLGLLIVYTLLVGLIELQFHVTVAQILVHLMRLLVGG